MAVIAPRLSEQEHQSLLIDYNNSSAHYPDDKTIIELFEAQAERTPNHTAIQLDENSLSYAQLNERANQLAAHLRARGVGVGQLVVLYMEHSIEVVWAILGVLKAGAAYVPVEPASTPAERLAFILQDVAAGNAKSGVLPTLLTQSRLLSKIPEDFSDVLALDSDLAQMRQYASANPPPAASPRDLAYVIFTSGSTGKPKGVLIEHRSLLNYICWANNSYCKGERLVWPLFSSLAFDLTITSIFTPLISGGQIVVYPEEPSMHGMAILKVIADRAADIVKLTPSHLSMIRDMDLAATRIRKFIVGGEDFKTELARDISRKFGRPVELYNEYGPTEATVGCMIHRFEAEKDKGLSVPIGIPAANFGIYLLDEQLEPVGIGITGEMYIAGDGLARGYLNRPDLTAQRFVEVKNPRQNGRTHSGDSDMKTLRMYKTGDVARWSADGRMEFLGRADYQVKISGMRVELGEIEARLLTHPEISECVVAVTRDGSSNAGEDENGIDRLVAYYVSQERLNVADVRAHVAKELPDYMVPHYVVWLEKLPLSSNGKVDRKALPIPSYEHMEPAHSFIAPRTEIEKRLASIWTELLRVENIGVEDDFFNLGGHSLMAIRAEARIREVFGVNLGIQALFDNPTIAELAKLLKVPASPAPKPTMETTTNAKEHQILVRLRPGNSKRPPLFCVHGTGGTVLNMRPLAMALPAELPFYCFEDKGLDGSEPFENVEAQAQCYMDEIRKVQGHGPYHLCGTCFGGFTAFEMACQLEKLGEPVATLVLIDTFNLAFIRSLSSMERHLRNLRFYVKRSTWHARKMFRQPPAQWLGYINGRRRALRERIRDLGELATRTEEMMLEAADKTPVAENMKRIIHASLSAGHQFEPKPYGGSALIFRASGRELDPYDDYYLGWANVVKSGIECHEIEGDHMSILEEPTVRTLADTLDRYLLRFSSEGHTGSGASRSISVRQ